MKEFFDRLNRITKPGRQDIIEKDYHIHRLLHNIALDNHLQEKLVFKGGTCLIKAYTGYYRFSEDIDFTWKDTTLWEERTPSQTRKQCSTEIDLIIDRLKEIAENLGLVFDGDKKDTSQVEIGSGGRMVRFFIGYKSESLGIPARIKMEINFVDKTLYPYQTPILQSYINDLENKELQFLYKEAWNEYKTQINIECYDPREIFTDKARAIMTRIAYKFRDTIDIYTLENQYGYTIPDYKNPIKRKTRFMLDLYNRYKENIETATIPNTDHLPDGETKLLIHHPPKDLHKNIQRINTQIQQLQTELTNEKEQERSTLL